MLAQVMQSPAPESTAKALVGHMDGEFFANAEAFVGLAKKEGNEDVAAEIKRALQLCLDVKTSELRPELKLFNQVSIVSDANERLRILALNREHLTPYFSEVVQKVVDDLASAVEHSPAMAGPNTRQNLARTRCILSEAKAVLRADDGA